MSGPELHANIVETLLTGKFPRPVPHSLRLLYPALALLLGSMLFFRLSSWWGLAAAGVMCLLSGALAYILFLHHVHPEKAELVAGDSEY